MAEKGIQGEAKAESVKSSVTGVAAAGLLLSGSLGIRLGTRYTAGVPGIWLGTTAWVREEEQTRNLEGQGILI